MNKKVCVFIEIVIYILFIFFDLINKNSTLIKYLGIVLCLLYSLMCSNKLKSLALLFTAIADLFLLVLNKYYEFGLFIFICAQLTYLYILRNNNFKFFCVLRLGLIIIGMVALYIMNVVSLLNALVVIYFSNLLVNTIESYSYNRIMFVGFCLFICCDICVGLHNINAANNIATFLMWIFYLPSQVLITLA